VNPVRTDELALVASSLGESPRCARETQRPGENGVVTIAAIPGLTSERWLMGTDVSI